MLAKAFGRDIVEAPARALENRRLASELLVPPNDDVAEEWIQLEQASVATSSLGRDQRAP